MKKDKKNKDDKKKAEPKRKPTPSTYFDIFKKKSRES